MSIKLPVPREPDPFPELEADGTRYVSALRPPAPESSIPPAVLSLTPAKAVMRERYRRGLEQAEAREAIRALDEDAAARATFLEPLWRALIRMLVGT